MSRLFRWTMALGLVLSSAVPLLAQAAPFEDFFTNELRKWDALTCCWQIVGYEDGKLLRQKADDAKGNTRVVVAERKFASAAIETRVRFAGYPHVSQSKADLERLGAGIMFAYHDENNYYLFRLAGDDKAVLGKVVGGKWIAIKDKVARTPATPAITDVEKAPWYILKVVVTPDAITCYVDDSAVFTAHGEKPESGRVGFTTFHAVADFAYLKIH